MIHVVTIVAYLGLAAPGVAQDLTFAQQYSIPDWVTAAIQRAGLDATLSADARLNPFSLRGDFDGDGRADFALLVRARRSGKPGIAVIHRAGARVFVLGAGNDNSAGGDDFTWMDTWTVFDRGRVMQGAGTDRPPVLKGDALLVAKSEAASAILYWTGDRYRWYQQGD
jgi:hypothetical protein